MNEFLKRSLPIVKMVAQAVLTAAVVILLINCVIYIITHVFSFLGTATTTIILILLFSAIVITVCDALRRLWDLD